MQLDSSDLNREKKKLKRYLDEQKKLEEIIVHIKMCNNYKELKYNPISTIFGFEELKHELNGYCGFKLGKVIRLIISVNETENKVKIEFISINHYDDFKRKLKEGK